MKDFASKTAAITGAGSGIGRALALALAQRGCHLALADIDSAALTASCDSVSSLGVRCTQHPLDVADGHAVRQFAGDVVQTHGAVHLVFNNAGVTVVDRIESLTDEDFHWLMNINFWGVVHGTRAFLPYLRQVDQAQIVNISSLFGLMAVPLQGAYHASKFAVRGFTESLKMELAGSSVGVSCVHPGGVKTAIARKARFRKAAGGTHDDLNSRFDRLARTSPEQAAQQILRGVAKGRRRIVVGNDARLADWIVRWFPGSYERILRLEK